MIQIRPERSNDLHLLSLARKKTTHAAFQRFEVSLLVSQSAAAAHFNMIIGK
jgi:hypothetical protein